MNNNTFILIHGAWHANWCWEKIKSSLEAYGHKALTPNLPGRGEDRTSFDNITLSGYANAIKSLMLRENKPVILVGHSMAGIILSQLAEEIPGKIQKLVYVAAFMPKNGESLMDTAKQFETKGISTELIFLDKEYAIDIKKSEQTRSIFFNTCSVDIAESALQQLVPEPSQPFFDKLTLTETKFGKVNKCYIECLEDKAITPSDQKRMYQNVVDEVISLKCDHSPFLSSPTELTQILHQQALSETKKEVSI